MPRTLILALTLLVGAAFADPTLRTESFDRDPAWDGLNNRSKAFEPRQIEQDFGYSPDGTVGGTITPDGTPAYYAKKLSTTDLNAPLSASGTIRVEKGGGNLLFGFFNADTVNEWRTPNSIVYRINGRGEIFHAHIEYATSKWRAGAGVIGRLDAAADRIYPLEIPGEGVHKWSLAYDPNGAGGRGEITATFDDQRAVCALTEGHQADGATFNRFGLLNVVKHADNPGKVWLGDLRINGELQDLSADPAWEGRGNRARYLSKEVRPRFNFGYSPTQFAHGAAAGELGGLFFRGDCRYPERLAYCGAPLEPLTLQKPLRASGKLALRRAVSDSTTLLGFFHSEESVRVNPAQNEGLPMNVMGFAVEGPSSQGFYVYPVFRVQDGKSNGIAEGAPLVYPNGDPHTWTLEYLPPATGDDGTLTLTLDGTKAEVKVPAALATEATVFNRFGLVTPWIDGNGQVIYFDDLTFTCK
jgi:hypothetical protein